MVYPVTVNCMPWKTMSSPSVTVPPVAEKIATPFCQDWFFVAPSVKLVVKLFRVPVPPWTGSIGSNVVWTPSQNWVEVVEELTIRLTWPVTPVLTISENPGGNVPRARVLSISAPV